MGLIEDGISWFTQSTPAGAAATVGEKVVGSVLHGVSEIIRDLKLPPEAQVAFETRMAELQAQAAVVMVQAAQADRDSARKREMAVGGRTPAVLAYGVVGGFLFMTCGIIVSAMTGYTIDPTAMGLIGTLVGYLSAKSELVLAYYFGDSFSAASKK